MRTNHFMLRIRKPKILFTQERYYNLHDDVAIFVYCMGDRCARLLRHPMRVDGRDAIIIHADREFEI